MTRVLITGGGGFCGQHLVRYLRTQGADVWTMGTGSAPQAQHHRIKDITSTAEIDTVLTVVRPDYVFHLAGVAKAANAATFYQVNSAYAAALVQALQQSGLADACPTMLVGSSAEYGEITPEQLPIHEATEVLPYHHYGISKLAQTHLGTAAARTGQPLIMARPFNVIGPGMPPHLSVQSFVSQMVSIIRRQHAPTIQVGNLNSSRDFIDVEAAVEVYWKLIQNPQAYGNVVNVCSGQAVVMSDLLETLIELTGIEIEVQIDPQRLKAFDIPMHYGCTKKLTDLIGSTPKFDLRRTLKRLLDGLLSTSPQND